MAHSQRYLIFLAFGLLCLAARADAPMNPPAGPTGTFRLVSLGAAEPFLYDVAPRSTRTIRPAVSTYTKPQPIPADGKLRFYRLGEPTEPRLPPPHIPVAEITVDTTEPRPLLVILIPGGLPNLPPQTLSNGKPAEFSALVLDDSPEIAPVNHLRVVNFSRRPSGVVLGSQTITVPPLQSALIPYPDVKRAPFKVATRIGDSWFPLISNSQMLSPNTRLTLFLSDIDPAPDSTSLELVLRKIVEVF